MPYFDVRFVWPDKREVGGSTPPGPTEIPHESQSPAPTYTVAGLFHCCVACDCRKEVSDANGVKLAALIPT
jgi:hypothetical protein